MARPAVKQVEQVEPWQASKQASYRGLEDALARAHVVAQLGDGLVHDCAGAHVHVGVAQ